MTKQEWLEVKEGDVLVDVKSKTERPVLKVSRVSGKPGQGNNTRTHVTVPRMKTKSTGVADNETIAISNSDDVRGVRFQLVRA